ncbi:hypothetical protein BKA70DRAFT_1439091 [Coprinopsis sp. MPI-PUGE-AT-0042]|nr:hypothetical protein BKA70DRAFT_1439091 [Coprinopsis sp. MPI-PUGE-AT-0042]
MPMSGDTREQVRDGPLRLSRTTWFWTMEDVEMGGYRHIAAMPWNAFVAPIQLQHHSFHGRGNLGGLPMTEAPSASSIGIGSMPGSNYEAGITTLTEEREGGQPYGTLCTAFKDYSPAKGGLHPKLIEDEGKEHGNSVHEGSFTGHLIRKVGHNRTQIDVPHHLAKLQDDTWINRRATSSAGRFAQPPASAPALCYTPHALTGTKTRFSLEIRWQAGAWAASDKPRKKGALPSH